MANADGQLTEYKICTITFPSKLRRLFAKKKIRVSRQYWVKQRTVGSVIIRHKSCQFGVGTIDSGDVLALSICRCNSKHKSAILGETEDSVEM